MYVVVGGYLKGWGTVKYRVYGLHVVGIIHCGVRGNMGMCKVVGWVST